MTVFRNKNMWSINSDPHSINPAVFVFENMQNKLYV